MQYYTYISNLPEHDESKQELPTGPAVSPVGSVACSAPISDDLKPQYGIESINFGVVNKRLTGKAILLHQKTSLHKCSYDTPVADAQLVSPVLLVHVAWNSACESSKYSESQRYRTVQLESDGETNLISELAIYQIYVRPIKSIRPPARRRLTSDRWMSPEVHKSLEYVR